MFEDKTPEAIKETMKEQLQTDLATNEGSFVDDLLGPAALELYKVYGSLEGLRDMVWVNESSGLHLDLAAEDIGIGLRKEGTNAKVLLMVTGTAGYTIPKGKAFLTLDNLYFDAIEAKLIPSGGQVEVQAEAREPGARYNVWAGEVTLQFENSAYITAVTNPEAAQGGTDEESDAALYARISLARQKPRTSGNVHDYEAWALEISGVGAVRVLPLWNGPGTVKVLIGDEQTQPVDDAVTAACLEHIEAERPVGAEVTVSSVEALAVDVEAAVHLSATADPDAVKEAFTAALAGYFALFSLEQEELRYNWVAALLVTVDGVLDYETLTINGQVGNLPLSAEQVPTVGEVSITCV